MAAEAVLETVEKLQARLGAGGGEPKRLYKSLKRLAELPITVDILAETGVGKTVNGLRKHELVGEFAKSLVARWKKLVPQEAERNNVHSEEQEIHRSSSRKQPRVPSPHEEDDDQEGEYRAAIHPPRSQALEQISRDRKSRKDAERARTVREERWQPPPPPVQDSDHEASDDEYGHLAEPPDSPPLIFIDQCEPELSSSRHKISKSHSHHASGGPVKGHRESLEVPRPSKEQRPLHREKPRAEARLGEERSQERLSRPSGKESHRDLQCGEHGARKGRDNDLPPPPSSSEHSARRERSHEHTAAPASSKKERPQPLSESPEPIKKKHREPEKSKSERVRPDVEGQRARLEREAEPSSRGREGKGKAPDSSAHEKKSVMFAPVVDTEVDDKFEQPTMSFESYLSYDLPKKKKKPVKPPAPAPPPAPVRVSSSSKQNGTKGSSKTSEPSRKSSHPKRERTPSPPPKAKKIKIDVVPTLPDIPLPPIQPNYRPLPTLETATFSPPKKKAVTPVLEEEEAGFTGRRFNSKMQVYSGSKAANLPKMMSLYEQCIRVLANNIDLIDEVGGVPYSVLEPVLEKCTPEQLYRIEELNHVLIEDTDRLWMCHGQRDFKKDQPEEFESWREMYLRLHDAREQKLAMLTQNIRSAHQNKPKLRQAKMAFVNVEAKPPRDVRRRQEKFGTGAAVVKEKIRIKPFTPIRISAPAEESYAEEPRSYDGPSTSSAYAGNSASSVSPPMTDPRRPQVKRIAPMMAKTIKAFKNRFSRR